MKTIAVVGSLVMDLVAQVDAFPLEGQTIIGGDFSSHPGGKGANQAVSAARMGAQVKMYGKVGADDYGKTFLEVLNNEGIDAAGVSVDAEAPTALGLIQINRCAENKIVVVPGANYAYSCDDLERDLEAVLNCDLVIAQLELRHEVTYALIEACDKAGVPVILNPAPAVELPVSVLSKVTYLTPNETELGILTGLPVDTREEVAAAVAKLLDMGVQTVVATMGKRGAVIGTRAGLDTVGAYTVEAIDTVAAGDAFNGALAYGVTEGMSMKAAVGFANAVGALAVTKRGAIPSLPYKKEVLEFIEKAL